MGECDEECQLAFFDFCTGKRYHIVARVETVKVTLKIWIAGVKVAKMAQLIGLSPMCGTRYSLFCGLALVRVAPVKMLQQIAL